MHDSFSRPNSPLAILVVDDEPGLPEVISEMLKVDGHQAAAATMGTDALDMARADRYDLIISDYRMPGLNGAELMRALRGELKHRFWFALMTVLTHREARDLCPDADAYLRKPFEARELTAVIERCRTALHSKGNGAAGVL